MWWSAVVQMNRQVGTHNRAGNKAWVVQRAVLGEKRAKKAAKALRRSNIGNRGPGQPRIVESRLILAGCLGMTESAD